MLLKQGCATLTCEPLIMCYDFPSDPCIYWVGKVGAANQRMGSQGGGAVSSKSTWVNPLQQSSHPLWTRIKHEGVSVTFEELISLTKLKSSDWSCASSVASVLWNRLFCYTAWANCYDCLTLGIICTIQWTCAAYRTKVNQDFCTVAIFQLSFYISLQLHTHTIKRNKPKEMLLILWESATPFNVG